MGGSLDANTVDMRSAATADAIYAAPFNGRGYRPSIRAAKKLGDGTWQAASSSTVTSDAIAKQQFEINIPTACELLHCVRKRADFKWPDFVLPLRGIRDIALLTRLWYMPS